MGKENIAHLRDSLELLKRAAYYAVQASWFNPDDHEQATHRAADNVADALVECAEWLESRPDYTDGDAATSSRARGALAEWEQVRRGNVV